jgi:hypothetical protein
MNKLLFYISILISNFTFSQLWFDIGAKGGVGTGFLINKTLDKDSRLSVSPGMNYFYGGKFGINFGKEHSITLDGSYNTNEYSFLQTGIMDTKREYKYSFNYSTITFLPMYRRTTDAQYLEIGPEFSFFKKGAISDEANPIITTSASEAINPTQIGAVFGIGGYIIGNDVIALSMGLRFHYQFTNLISDQFSSSNYPFVNYPDITSASTTNPLSVQVVFELNYSLAQVARASCGKRVALVRF